MGYVFQKKLQLLIECFLNFFGQIIIFFFKPLAELIGSYFFSHFYPFNEIAKIIVENIQPVHKK